MREARSTPLFGNEGALLGEHIKAAETAETGGLALRSSS
jgi:hypothetical protein